MAWSKNSGWSKPNLSNGFTMGGRGQNYQNRNLPPVSGAKPYFGDKGLNAVYAWRKVGRQIVSFRLHPKKNGKGAGKVFTTSRKTGRPIQPVTLWVCSYKVGRFGQELVTSCIMNESSGHFSIPDIGLYGNFHKGYVGVKRKK